MIKIRKNRAFSFAEVLIIFAVMAVLIGITAPIIRNASAAYKQKLSSIKAHSTLKEIVDSMLNQSSTYSGNNNFSNNHPTEGNPSGDLQLFKSTFFEQLSVGNGNINDNQVICPIVDSNGNIQQSLCILGVDNIAWGILGSNFLNVGVTRVFQNGQENAYSPITVYPYYATSFTTNTGRQVSIHDTNRNVTIPQSQLNEYFCKNAVLYGLRRDGDLIYLDDFVKRNCGDAAFNHGAVFHVKAKNFISKN